MIPVTTSIFNAIPRTDFDNFLDSLGLQDSSSTVRSEMAVHVREIVLNTVFDMMAERLSPEKFRELAQLMDEAQKTDNPVAVNEFLTREIPGIDTIVEEAYNTVKDSIRRALANPSKTVEKFIETYGNADDRSQLRQTLDQGRQPNQSGTPTTSQTDELSLAEVRSAVQALRGNSGRVGQEAIQDELQDDSHSNSSQTPSSAIDDELNSLNRYAA